MSRNDSPLAPLYVDLDGTLTKTDTLWESLIWIARHNPAAFRRIVPLVFQKAAFKKAVRAASELAPSDLSYREELLDHLRTEQERGRTIVLATATHQDFATKIAEHLGLFTDVLATQGTTNLSGAAKRDAIQAHAQGPYEYIGDHPVDLPVWQGAQTAHAVLPVGEDWDERVSPAQRGQIFRRSGGSFADILRAMRPKQWSKNILLFLPLLLSHTFLVPEKLGSALLAFVSFSLSASSIYLVNDIFDIHADRHHPKKRFRPFASGALSIPQGLVAALVVGVFALLVASLLSPLFLAVIVGYIVTTCLYTLWLKKLPIIDLMLIGFFYTYRIVAGGIATEVPLTDWLLAFSTFFFLSIGIVKRYGELLLTVNGETTKKNNRGYIPSDLPLLLGFGLNSAFLSVVIFALYIHSSEVTKLYAHPTLLWGVVVALLVWIMRLWLLAQRGVIHDDPLLFTLRDRKSGALILLVVILLTIATF